MLVVAPDTGGSKFLCIHVLFHFWLWNFPLYSSSEKNVVYSHFGCNSLLLYWSFTGMMVELGGGWAFLTF